MSKTAHLSVALKWVATRLLPLALAHHQLGALLGVFAELQSVDSPAMKIPAQWLLVAAAPFLLLLLIGGYIGRLKAGGFEVDLLDRPGARSLTVVDGQNASRTIVDGIDLSPIAREVLGTPGSGTSKENEWQLLRHAEYARTDNLFLVHVYQKSRIPGQTYDVGIFLLRHVAGQEPNHKSGFTDIESTQFYLGPSWGDRVFIAPNNGGYIGIRTTAWGTFLATCRITFTNGKEPIVLHRYVDFEMARPVT
jgi:hypothetical protein